MKTDAKQTGGKFVTEKKENSNKNGVCNLIKNSINKQANVNDE